MKLPHQPLPIHVLRAGVALIMIIHGLARWSAGGVPPFGAALGSWGFPAGEVIAWTITVVEIVGGLLLALGLGVVPLCAWFAVQLAAGIFLVHAKSGWFVVGLGRNGMEFSVLLILCLLCLAWLHWPKNSGAAAAPTQ